MQESSWPENDSFNELQPISALLADLAHLPESDEDPEPESYRTGNRRRRAAVALVIIWSGTIALHLATWGSWFVLGLTTLMGIHAVRILCARPLPPPKALDDVELETLPFVSLMVAAKNEEAVIGRLVPALCSLDYPNNRYEVWIIDDNSTDRTPALLQQFSQQYQNLRVFHRPPNSTGGKSGALNQVLPLTQGEIIAVFDADAQVAPDLLRRVLPLFERPNLGAVQVRKQVANVSSNAWIQGQIAEMALDSYFQQQRIAIGGIGELRGNGQFVRRAALDDCGGWNEKTITDDLDLTIRLHLHKWDIDFTVMPAVREEGVTKAIALWHQRNRWAEGGYQRYLDYWQLILRNRMGTGKTIDLVMFWITQYFLPTAAIPDTLMAIIRHRPMMLIPVTSLSITLSLIGMLIGQRRIRRSQTALKGYSPSGTTTADATEIKPQFVFFSSLLRAFYGTLYMLHWFPVMASTTARMAVRPNRLKWVKTVHYGAEESP
ncbi:glycosyltransferase [Leptodesmis sp.]|uniref:glycosyltransferase n=1 Tax=Leptodesmis sp. TaxID=3100501 RepID=UPI0040534A92